MDSQYKILEPSYMVTNLWWGKNWWISIGSKLAKTSCSHFEAIAHTRFVIWCATPSCHGPRVTVFFFPHKLGLCYTSLTTPDTTISFNPGSAYSIPAVRYVLYWFSLSLSKIYDLYCLCRATQEIQILQCQISNLTHVSASVLCLFVLSTSKVGIRWSSILSIDLRQMQLISSWLTNPNCLPLWHVKRACNFLLTVLCC